jgi:hypothetical protein
MSGFHVTPASGADLDAIVEGFARACGRPAEAIAAKVRWGLEGNPSGWSGVVARDARGKVVGHFGVTHVPMSIDGKDVLFGRAYASWVEPELRTAGVHSAFAEMDDAFREHGASNGVAASFGVFADGDWWTLRRIRDWEPVRTELTLVRPPAPHRETPGLVELAAFTPAALAAWDGAIDQGPCASRRDGKVLAFRLGGPHAGDRAWAVLRGGRPAAVAAVREGAAGRVVLDFAVPEGDEEAAAALLDRVIGDGSVAVRLDWFSRSPWFLLAQRRGFRAAPGDLAYLALRAAKPGIEAHWLMENWRVTAADVGLHALPRMLASEDVVTSPPIGTLTGRERHA